MKECPASGELHGRRGCRCVASRCWWRSALLAACAVRRESRGRPAMAASLPRNTTTSGPEDRGARPRGRPTARRRRRAHHRRRAGGLRGRSPQDEGDEADEGDDEFDQALADCLGDRRSPSSNTSDDEPQASTPGFDNARRTTRPVSEVVVYADGGGGRRRDLALVAGPGHPALLSLDAVQRPGGELTRRSDFGEASVEETSRSRASARNAVRVRGSRSPTSSDGDGAWRSTWTTCSSSQGRAGITVRLHGSRAPPFDQALGLRARHDGRRPQFPAAA